MSTESVMPFNYLILYCPLLLLPSVFPSIKVSSNESAVYIRWPKYWSFSFSINPSKEYLGLVSFRIDGFDLLVLQGTLKCLLQHHNFTASILWHSAFFMVQLSHQNLKILLETYWSSSMNLVKLQNTKLIHRNLSHFYTLKIRYQKEKLRKNPFTIASKRIEYLWINLPKEAKDQYSENNKMVMKEIKDDTNRWKDTPCSLIWFDSLIDSWKNQYCQNDYTTQCSLQIKCNPYQITNGIFADLEPKKS